MHINFSQYMTFLLKTGFPWKNGETNKMDDIFRRRSTEKKYANFEFPHIISFGEN